MPSSARSAATSTRRVRAGDSPRSTRSASSDSNWQSTSTAARRSSAAWSPRALELRSEVRGGLVGELATPPADDVRDHRRAGRRGQRDPGRGRHRVVEVEPVLREPLDALAPAVPHRGPRGGRTARPPASAGPAPPGAAGRGPGSSGRPTSARPRTGRPRPPPWARAGPRRTVRAPRRGRRRCCGGASPGDRRCPRAPRCSRRHANPAAAAPDRFRAAGPRHGLGWSRDRGATVPTEHGGVPGRGHPAAHLRGALPHADPRAGRHRDRLRPGLRGHRDPGGLRGRRPRHAVRPPGRHARPAHRGRAVRRRPLRHPGDRAPAAPGHRVGQLRSVPARRGGAAPRRGRARRRERGASAP